MKSCFFFSESEAERVKLKVLSCRSSRVTHLLSRATLLPRTQLSCSWTHSAVLCKSAARPAVGGGLGPLWLASEPRFRDVMEGCCLCGGGAGGRGGGPCWMEWWSPGERERHQHVNDTLCKTRQQTATQQTRISKYNRERDNKNEMQPLQKEKEIRTTFMATRVIVT